MNALFRTVALSLLLAGCQDPTPEPPVASLSERQQALVGGEVSDASEDYGVLIITDVGTQGRGIGSGVMVAPNLVLVAFHSVAFTNAPSANYFPCKPGQTTIEAYSLIEPSEVFVYPGVKRPGPNQLSPVPVKKIIPMPVADLCRGDLALLLLESDLPGAVIAPIRLDGEVKVGDPLYAVGWGMMDYQGSLPKERQKLTGMKVLAVGPGTYQNPGGLSPYDLYENHFVATNGPCIGDSGSGAYDPTTKAVIGTLSAGQNDNPTKLSTPEEPAKPCEGAAIFYVRLSYFKDQILAAFKEANHAPWLEGKPKPASFGSACSEAGDCDSSQCVRQVCSRGCAEQACPEGYECLTQDQAAGPQCVSTEAGQAGQSAGLQGSGCEGSSDCVSGICLQPAGSDKICSSRCDTGPCEGGWTCEVVSGNSVCLPPSLSAPTAGGDGCQVGLVAGKMGWSGVGLGALAVLGWVGRRRRSKA